MEQVKRSANGGIVSAVVPDGEEYPLQHSWIFYFDEKASKGLQRDSYTNALKRLGEFSNVIDFWRYANNIEVGNLPPNSNLRMFKSGIEPTWEDPANAHGGKYVFEVPHGVSLKDVWTYTMLALIGEMFETNDSICGAVLSIRPRNGSTINIWNSSAYHPEDIHRGEADIQRTIVEKLAELKRQPVSLQLHYQPHQKSVDWNQLWTTTKSKETVKASLASSTEAIQPKRTLTASPSSKRRSHLSVDQSISPQSKSSLRSSTGSMPHARKLSGNGTSTQSPSDHTHKTPIPPLSASPTSDARRSTGSIPSRPQQTQAQGGRSMSSNFFSPESSASSSSSPSSSNPLNHNTRHSEDDLDEDHDLDNGNEDMRSPFFTLLDDSSSSPRHSHRPLKGSSNQVPTDPTNAISPRSDSSGPETPQAGPIFIRSSKDSIPAPSTETGTLHRSDSGSSEWASMKFLAEGHDSSEPPSPRRPTLSETLQSTSCSPSTSFQLGHSSLDSSRIVKQDEPTASFANVLRELQETWWTKKKYRRRGRPSSSLNSPATLSSVSHHLSAPSTSHSSSSDSQLKVPGTMSNDLESPSSPGATLSVNGTQTQPLAPIATGGPRKRKRPSRGGSRDKTRSKDNSPASPGTPVPVVGISSSSSPPPPPHSLISFKSQYGANIDEECPPSSPPTPPVPASPSSIQFLSVNTILPSTPEDLETHPLTPEEAPEIPTDLPQISFDLRAAVDDNVATFDSTTTPRLRILHEESEHATSTASTPVAGQSTETSSAASTPSPGPMPSVGTNYAAAAARHHRRRSRGRGAGASVDRKSRFEAPNGTLPPSGPSYAEILKSIGMVIIILLLMLICYFLGKMQATGGVQQHYYHNADSEASPFPSRVPRTPNL